MKRNRLPWAAAFLLPFLLSTCMARVPRPGHAPSTGATDTQQVTLTILQMNDVYELTPVSGGKEGGLARVATLRKELDLQQRLRQAAHALPRRSGAPGGRAEEPRRSDRPSRSFRTDHRQQPGGVCDVRRRRRDCTRPGGGTARAEYPGLRLSPA